MNMLLSVLQGSPQLDAGEWTIDLEYSQNSLTPIPKGQGCALVHILELSVL